MDRGLIVGEEQAQPEEPLVAFAAAEGANEQHEMKYRFAQSFSSRAPYFFATAIRTNQNSRQLRCLIHRDPTLLSYRNWLGALLFQKDASQAKGGYS